ncbi:MAG: family 20 glycosylhydrolase [Bacteroides sp.]
MKYSPSFLLFLLFSLLLTPASGQTLNLIPQPLQTECRQGQFVLNPRTRLCTNLRGEQREQLLTLLKSTPLDLPLIRKERKANTIVLRLDAPSAAYPTSESYRVDVSPARITLSAASDAGLFYATRTLLQLVAADGRVPALLIDDSPRFPYRGMHLDVSRHFRDKAFLKKQLDAMAYYKLNRFHWHLTDGAGWRIEIKKYPLLTDVAAWRPFATWKDWWKGNKHYCRQDDPQAQGGFYTQEDVKEIVAYAAARHITVIPEIEMPGHSEEVLAVYPQLSCSGEPYVNSDFCIGNEQTFGFLEDVLTEIMPLFPSTYIHIGGDEASKTGWKTCPKCAARMKTEHLNSVDELQSYLIHRIERFLNAHGRKLLGWDEIMQGGLTPGATVMSWRGEEGGIAAARAGHQAVMTPGGYCYLDHSQDDPTAEPESIGGYVPLEKVYSYNPVPDSLTAAQQALILGVQANLWTEYIATPDYAEYMLYPRVLALAEVAWTAPARKSYPDFRRRALHAVTWLESRGYHPFPLSRERGERAVSLQPVQHLATGKTVTYRTPFSPQYPAGGEAALVNGLRGGWTYGDQRWQGFLEQGMDVVIDLGSVQPIHSVQADWMQLSGPWVWMPQEVIIEISTDGQTFSPLSSTATDVPRDYDKLLFRQYGWTGTAQARYVRYIARTDKRGGFIFTDEIIIR